MLKHDAKLDMTFESFYEIYVEDMQRIEFVIIPGERKQILPELKFFHISESVK